MARAARARRASTSTGRCPATPTCSAPSPCTSATTCSPTSGCSRATATRFAFAEREAGRLPLGAGALAGVNFDTDRALLARELGFAEVAPELDRRRLRARLRARLPRRRRDLRDAPLAPRRRARAVVEQRVRLLRAARRVELGLARSCRRRRTPTRPSCCARRRRAWSAHLAALHGVMHALPLTYNKDLQEDKEHLFDAVDTLELTLAAATGHDRRRALRPRAHARGGRRRADRGDRRRRPARAPRDARSARPTASSPGSCARAVDSGQPLSELTAEELAAQSELLAEHAERVPRRCSRRAPGWSPRCPRAAPRSRACASSSRLRAARAR